MDLSCVPCSRWLRAQVIVGIVGFFAVCPERAVHGQAAVKAGATRSDMSVVRDVHSRHFLIHTDLSADEADAFIEPMEVMLGQISQYWGQSLRGVIECYVIRNLEQFPMANTAPVGVRGLKTAGGMTLMPINTEGKRPVAKSIVYASARLEVLQHEVVHAYCHQTFSRIGPIWYSEGMAEMGHFWQEEDATVRADPREIEFLHDHPPKSLAEPLSPSQVTGDCWQNYASRWALCHFMVSNPNYSRQFRQLGRGFLAGKNVSFEQTFTPTKRQLFFEYLLFLEHIGRGYRVDLCAWDWKTPFAPLQPEQTLVVPVAAGRGWQPTGLAIRSGIQYEYVASGKWQIAEAPETVDTNGDDQGRGRLVGVLMKDYQLGPEFELGTKGSLQLKGDGDLYLRCRHDWNQLAGDRGTVTVHLQSQGLADGPAPCPAASGDRQ